MSRSTKKGPFVEPKLMKRVEAARRGGERTGIRTWARARLKSWPTPHGGLVAKIVKSAASNAENNFALDADSLYVKRAVAGDARRPSRARPAARGRIPR